MNSLKKKLRKIRREKRLFELLYFVFAFVLPVAFTYLYVPTITFNPAALESISFDSHAVLANNVSRVSFSLSLIVTILFVLTNGVKYIKERLQQMPFSGMKQFFYFLKGAMIPFVIIGLDILLESILHGLIRGLQLTLIMNAVFIFIAVIAFGTRSPGQLVGAAMLFLIPLGILAIRRAQQRALER